MELASCLSSFSNSFFGRFTFVAAAVKPLSASDMDIQPHTCTESDYLCADHIGFISLGFTGYKGSVT